MKVRDIKNLKKRQNYEGYKMEAKTIKNVERKLE